MQAKIKNKQEIATSTLLVEIDLLGQEVNFTPGQYFFITLPKLDFDDHRGATRHFSILNTPKQKSLLSFATRIRKESGFKKTLANLPIGTEVEVKNIAGKFVLPDNKTRPIVFLAGGIGITPFICMLRHIQEEQLEYKITVIYSNRDQAATAFKSELEQIAQNNPNIQLILTMTEDLNWMGEKTMVDASFIKEYLVEPSSYTFYTAGPPPMVEAVNKALLEAGVSEENIRKENFSGY